MEAIGTQALTEGTYHSPEVMSHKIDAVSSADVINVSDTCVSAHTRAVTLCVFTLQFL